MDDHGQEFPIRMQRGSQVLLFTQDDVSLDPIQQGEGGFKQCSSLDGAEGKGYQHKASSHADSPREEEKEGN